MDTNPFVLKPLESSPELDKLFEALAKAQGAYEVAVLDQKNPHFNSEYASLKSLKEATQEALKANSIAVVQNVFSIDRKYFIRSTLGHSSGQWMASTIELLIDRANMQGMGSAITYGKRYSYAAIVGVFDGDDDDGNSAVQAQSKTASEIQKKREETRPAQTPFVRNLTQPNAIKTPLVANENGQERRVKSPLDQMIDIMKEREYTNDQARHLFERVTGFKKSAKDLTPEEIQNVIKYLNMKTSPPEVARVDAGAGPDLPAPNLM